MVAILHQTMSIERININYRKSETIFANLNLIWASESHWMRTICANVFLHWSLYQFILSGFCKLPTLLLQITIERIIEQPFKFKPKLHFHVDGWKWWQSQCHSSDSEWTKFWHRAHRTGPLKSLDMSTKIHSPTMSFPLIPPYPTSRNVKAE